MSRKTESEARSAENSFSERNNVQTVVLDPKDRDAVSDDCDVGVSYTGSTSALGADRLGSIPSTPTKKYFVQNDVRSRAKWYKSYHADKLSKRDSTKNTG